MRTSLAIAALLLAMPLALAHDPAGTPKNHCERFEEWDTHDYGGPSPGNLVIGREDGNSAGDCDGDGVPGDSDRHAEYAIGGAFLSVDSGDGFSHGSIACLGEEGHHGPYPTVEVTDVAQGQGQFFVVTADYSRPGSVLAGELDCGDNLVEVCNHGAEIPIVGDGPVNDLFVSITENPETTCNPLDQAIVGTGSVKVPFPPGIDGVYAVFVGQGGTQGHVRTTYEQGREPGELPFVCPGHGAYS